MHEQSETIQGRDKRYYNIYGQGTGATQPMPLPQVFQQEQRSYPTLGQATNMAAWRSQLGHGQYPTQSPQYGFSNSYQPPTNFGRIIADLLRQRFGNNQR